MYVRGREISCVSGGVRCWCHKSICIRNDSIAVAPCPVSKFVGSCVRHCIFRVGGSMTATADKPGWYQTVADENVKPEALLWGCFEKLQKRSKILFSNTVIDAG